MPFRAQCFGDSANKIYMGGGTVDLYTMATYNNGFETSTTTPDDSLLQAHTNVSITGNGTVNDALTTSQLANSSSLQFTGLITANNGGMSAYSINGGAEVKFDGAVSGAGNMTFENGTGYFGEQFCETYSK